MCLGLCLCDAPDRLPNLGLAYTLTPTDEPTGLAMAHLAGWTLALVLMTVLRYQLCLTEIPTGSESAVFDA